MKKKTLSKLTDKKIILKQKGDGNFCKNNFLLSTENSKGYWYPRLDTVKLSIPINNNDYHKALLRVKHIMNEKDKYPGLVYIDLYTSKYTLPKNFISIQVSSKLLRNRYFDGINYRNIKQVLDFINYFIEDIVKATLDNTYVVSCDLKRDLWVKDSKKLIEYIDSCNGYNTLKYNKNNYKKESLIFTTKEKTKSIRERITIYNKSAELSKKNNLELQDILKQEGIHLSNIVRFELRIKYHNLINYYLFGENKYSSKKRTLVEVLAGKNNRNPIGEIFQNIFSYCLESLDISSDEWLPILKQEKPMKFATGVGIVAQMLLAKDNINTMYHWQKTAYGEKTCLSKTQKEKISRAVFSSSSLTQEEYDTIAKIFIPRIKSYFGYNIQSINVLGKLSETLNLCDIEGITPFIFMGQQL